MWYANEMHAYTLGGIVFLFIMVWLWWIYYYIQEKIRVKDANSLPLVPLFNMGLMLKVLRESICAHKDSSLIPKYQGH